LTIKEKQESRLELKYSGYGSVLYANIPAEDATWIELLKSFTDFLRGTGYVIDASALESVRLPGEVERREADETQVFLNQVNALKDDLREKLSASDAEKVAARLVSLADSGFRVVELAIPAAKIGKVNELPISIYEYTDKVSVKHGKNDTEIKFIIELGK